LEIVKLCAGAAQIYMVGRNFRQVHRNQPTQTLPMLRLNNQMSDLILDRIEHYLGYATADSVGTACGYPNDDRSPFWHSNLLVFSQL
jgi:hypothetical protein